MLIKLGWSDRGPVHGELASISLGGPEMMERDTRNGETIKGHEDVNGDVPKRILTSARNDDGFGPFIKLDPPL